MRALDDAGIKVGVAPHRASIARRRVPHAHRSLAPRRCPRRMTTTDAYCDYLRGARRRPPPARRLPMLRDAMIIFRYQMRLLLREPVWIIVVMIQPLLYLALFAPLLEPIAKTPGLPARRRVAGVRARPADPARHLRQHVRRVRHHRRDPLRHRRAHARDAREPARPAARPRAARHARAARPGRAAHADRGRVRAARAARSAR